MLPRWVFGLADAVDALERCVPRPIRPDDNQPPQIVAQLDNTELPRRKPRLVQANGGVAV